MPEHGRIDGKQNIETATDWTEEQLQVIEARDKSLLVSAAAGSGKTAVLVERILSMITDREHPVDVDELLVVTFTKAAASQMRERILSALDEAAGECPDNTHLQRQLSLIHNAQITTVDSFCLQVVTNHFHRIDLEPGFRIADEGELTLIEEDACNAVLNQFYEERDPSFLRFVEGYSDAKSDKKIREMILSLYHYSQSYPWPEEWLDDCFKQYEAVTLSDLGRKEWMRDYLGYYHQRVGEMIDQYQRIVSLTQEADGPCAYEGVIKDDLSQLETLFSCRGLKEWSSAVQDVHFKRLPNSAGRSASEEKKTEVKNARDDVSAQIKELQKKDFSKDPQAQLEVINKTGEMVKILVRLTKAYARRYAEEKVKKNVLDFSDAEHFALRILVDAKTKEPTEIAREYQKQFHEVMIDEYQDSNYLQEAILTAVSGIPKGRENLFMVGDIKQSIYRFRLARPELFLSKYETFSRQDNPKQRIDLHKNFRSRKEILAIVNDLFGRIMGADLGNVEYDEDAALYQGRKTADDETGTYVPECILIESENRQDRRQKEAAAIARRIRKMIREEEIPGIEYRDVVILLRSMNNWTQAFVQAFEQEGVPLQVTSKTGYFSAQEVQVILSLLRLLDNPRQDIPLATVMRSPIGNFSDEELALIKAYDPQSPFFECAENFSLEEGTVSNPALRGKMQQFFLRLDRFRKKVPYTPIHLLIQQIYQETGYRDFVSALPAGEQRQANLDMLLEKAIAYEKTSYHGLFHFVRYIDRLIKYNVDIGEAETVSEQENAVRLMTIHKSKGLEFPVVFVAGMGNQFNMRDMSSDMIFHQKYGVGLKFCDPDRRTKTDVLIRRAFSIEAKKENLGEEMRILYVAMTRAREKLILTGAAYDHSPQAPTTLAPYQKLGLSDRMDARSYWDWVLPALATYGDTYPLCISGIETEREEDKVHYEKITEKKSALKDKLDSTDDKLLTEINKNFLWKYPYPQSALKQKMSVSEIKHRAMSEAGIILDESGGAELFPDEIPIPYIPRFVKEPDKNTGALRGTAFHRLMECLDFSELPDSRSFKEAEIWLKEELQRIQEKKLMDADDVQLIDLPMVVRFLTSSLAQRMRTAAKKKLLVREQPFVMSIGANWFENEPDRDEKVLVQGIIDAFWEEDEKIILLDYKTDHVDTTEELMIRYQAQIRLYAEALRRSFPDRKLWRAEIYSFCLDREIPVNFDKYDGYK